MNRPVGSTGRTVDRRAVLRGAAAATAAALVGSRDESEPRFPVGFVSHGAPDLAIDRQRGADLARWGRGLPRPRSVLVLSAHWERSPATLGTVRSLPLYHDYGGFDPRLRSLVYPAPGAPELAERVNDLVGGMRREDDRPWDHGVWVPLAHLLPEADVPVLQLSLPSRSEPAALVDLGRRLAPLRDEGVWILASGGAVHDLGSLDWTERSGPAPWAAEFDRWLRAAVARGERDELIDWRARAPGAARAHPTDEHFAPLLVAAGAAGDDARVRFPVEGFEYGSLGRLSMEWT